MHHPCKLYAEEIVTYRWDNVNVAISIQSNRVYKQNRQSREIVLTEPLRARDGKLVRCAVLLYVSQPLRYHFLCKAHIVPCIPRHRRDETVDTTVQRNAESPQTKKPETVVSALDLLQ